jgi:Protein of unknown function (DUF3349)
MPLPPVLGCIIGWLRAGYPEGVPDVDYVPLFALLGSQLTDNEVTAIADELASQSDPEPAEAIRQAIKAATSTSSRPALTSTGSGPGWPPAAGRSPRPARSPEPATQPNVSTPAGPIEPHAPARAGKHAEASRVLRAGQEGNADDGHAA